MPSAIESIIILPIRSLKNLLVDKSKQGHRHFLDYHRYQLFLQLKISKVLVRQSIKYKWLKFYQKSFNWHSYLTVKFFKLYLRLESFYRNQPHASIHLTEFRSFLLKHA